MHVQKLIHIVFRSIHSHLSISSLHLQPGHKRLPAQSVVSLYLTGIALYDLVIILLELFISLAGLELRDDPGLILYLVPEQHALLKEVIVTKTKCHGLYSCTPSSFIIASAASLKRWRQKRSFLLSCSSCFILDVFSLHSARSLSYFSINTVSAFCVFDAGTDSSFFFLPI